MIPEEKFVVLRNSLRIVRECQRSAEFTSKAFTIEEEDLRKSSITSFLADNWLTHHWVLNIIVVFFVFHMVYYGNWSLLGGAVAGGATGVWQYVDTLTPAGRCRTVRQVGNKWENLKQQTQALRDSVVNSFNSTRITPRNLAEAAAKLHATKAQYLQLSKTNETCFLKACKKLGKPRDYQLRAQALDFQQFSVFRDLAHVAEGEQLANDVTDEALNKIQ